MNEIDVELECGWHTVNDAAVAYGTALVDDLDRIGQVTALGLDEVLFVRLGKWRPQMWSTQLVDVRRGQVVDVFPELSDPQPALRRQDQLGPTRDRHSPLIPETPN